jgi:AcrR family transcriptional regulator
MTPPPDTYHHGSLRRAVLDRTEEVIDESGIEAVKIRSIAADLGVTHTAVSHHVGSRTGLLTAVATEGFEIFAAELAHVRDTGGDLLDLGLVYVRFALEHPAHFRLMFRPDLLDNEDPDLNRPRDEAFSHLRGEVARLDGTESSNALTVAAWSMMHGLSELTLDGSLARSELLTSTDLTDVLDLARRAASHLAPRGPGD